MCAAPPEALPADAEPRRTGVERGAISCHGDGRRADASAPERAAVKPRPAWWGAGAATFAGIVAVSEGGAERGDGLGSAVRWGRGEGGVGVEFVEACSEGALGGRE